MDGTTCERKASLYTRSGSKDCDGWKGISLDDCKLKCIRNAMPSGKCPIKNAQCSYVHYKHGWGCHLADNTCNPQSSGDPTFTLAKMQG